MSKIQYLGGYPDCSKRFTALIKRINNDLVFYSYLISRKEQFRISKNDILNIRYERGSLRTNIKNLIIIKICYKNNGIEILLNGGIFGEKEYSELMSLAYSN